MFSFQITLAGFQGAAEAWNVEVSPRDVGEIERVYSGIREPNGGLILVPTALTVISRQLSIELAARYRLQPRFLGASCLSILPTHGCGSQPTSTRPTSRPLDAFRQLPDTGTLSRLKALGRNILCRLRIDLIAE